MPDPRPLTAAQERLWRAIARMMVALPRTIDEDLIATTGLSLSSYITMSQLSEAPDRQLRMSDLAERSALSPSRMTRVVQGLEERGYVRRTNSPSDRRTSLAVLTDDGFNAVRAAWPSHLRAVRDLAVDQIRPDELAVMTSVVERIVAAADARS